MDPSELTSLIVEYRYVALFPLLVIDGSVFGFVGGVLAGAGLFNPLIVYVLALAGRAVGDPVVYFSARHGSSYFTRIPRVKKILENVSQDEEEERKHETASFLHRHFVKLMIIAKTLPVLSISTALYVVGGIFKIPAKRVFTGTLIIQPFVSAIIVGTGFFLGGTIESPQHIVTALGVLVTLAVVAVWVYQEYIKPRLLGYSFFKIFKGWVE